MPAAAMLAAAVGAGPELQDVAVGDEAAGSSNMQLAQMMQQTTQMQLMQQQQSAHAQSEQTAAEQHVKKDAAKAVQAAEKETAKTAEREAAKAAKTAEKEAAKAAEKDAAPEQDAAAKPELLCQPSALKATFVADVTIHDGCMVEPGTPFQKVWRLRNTGSAPWPADTMLQQLPSRQAIDTLQMPGAGSPVRIGSVVAPGMDLDVRLDLVAPQRPGRHALHVSLASSGANPREFGDQFWCTITVPPPPSAPPLLVEQVQQQPQPAAVAAAVKADAAPAAQQPAQQEQQAVSAQQQQLLSQLLEMGFTDTALNLEVLQKNQDDLLEAVNDLTSMAEWDHLLDDLEEMGFEDRQQNRTLLLSNAGNMEEVVHRLQT